MLISVDIEPPDPDQDAQPVFTASATCVAADLTSFHVVHYQMNYGERN